ncbi:MAG: hypothetical protein GTO45_08785 [Candidatus Aminicenantes bacterium]|nr:hypothetical protein [Candidatus Aminicenantes bacterium]NIM78927.1 hypothetical protein [Candidatus Aminicenantes bacterium]NIN18187.1 hypothetical protein [Candidatus Aminicenantes bacterium]NIN42086.1 hypothetical protein [Candidatus Aminicenantes bacterium]NIN84839.1 hypothetical protein [Candidatus Aminicenantes bacterium]
MRTKKISKKLTFNKETIADLNWEELSSVRGGDELTLCLETLCVPCNTRVSFILPNCCPKDPERK